MLKQKKQIIIYILTGLLILSSLGFSFQHLGCNHCEVFSFMQAEKEQLLASSCCSNLQDPVNNVSGVDDLCKCSHDDLLKEQQKGDKTTPPAIGQINAVLYPCVITLFNILRTYFVPGINHEKPFELCIASGRDILSLNAVLLI